MALKWHNLPCVLKAAIGYSKRTLGHPASLSRAEGPQSRDKLKSAYGKLLSSTSRVVGQAKRFAKEIAEGVKRASDLMGQLALDANQEPRDREPAGLFVPAGLPCLAAMWQRHENREFCAGK